MMDLDSVLKNRDTTSLTIFPVIMYKCEGWTIKKAKHQRIDQTRKDPDVGNN